MKDELKIVTTKRGKDAGRTTLKDFPSFRKLAKHVRKINKRSQFNHSKRFMSQYDLAETKRALAVYNSRVKRNEIQRQSHGYYYICGCGAEGCVGYSEYTPQKNN